MNLAGDLRMQRAVIVRQSSKVSQQLPADELLALFSLGESVDSADRLRALLQVALRNRTHPIHECVLGIGLAQGARNSDKDGKGTNQDGPID